MIRVLDSAGSTLVEWGRQQQQHDIGTGEPVPVILTYSNLIHTLENIETLCHQYEQYVFFHNYLNYTCILGDVHPNRVPGAKHVLKYPCRVCD